MALVKDLLGQLKAYKAINDKIAQVNKDLMDIIKASRTILGLPPDEILPLENEEEARKEVESEVKVEESKEAKAMVDVEA